MPVKCKVLGMNNLRLMKWCSHCYSNEPDVNIFNPCTLDSQNMQSISIQ